MGGSRRQHQVKTARNKEELITSYIEILYNNPTIETASVIIDQNKVQIE